MKVALRASANRLLSQPDESEENLIYRSLLDVIMPEINPSDLPLFNSIIDDLFPKTTKENKGYEWLREIFEKKCNENGYDPVDALYKKLVEAYELSGYRKGVILVGNPYTGKSFVLRTLTEAVATKKNLNDDDMDLGRFLTIYYFIIRRMGVKVQFSNKFLEIVNPKAIDLKHLFGEFDPVNMEWKDGVISSVFRRFSDEKIRRTFKWMVFDGPVYSEWIENLNTVLDDNRKLCLSSGEVLNLSDNTQILFEVENLSHASPSTV